MNVTRFRPHNLEYMDSELWLTVATYRDVSVELRNAMEPPNKKLCSSLRGTATAAVHGDVLALEEGDVPGWVFSLSQDWGKSLCIPHRLT